MAGNTRKDGRSVVVSSILRKDEAHCVSSAVRRDIFVFCLNSVQQAHTRELIRLRKKVQTQTHTEKQVHIY